MLGASYKEYLLSTIGYFQERLDDAKAVFQKNFPEYYDQWMQSQGFAKADTDIIGGKTCHLTENRTVSVVDLSDDKFCVGLSFTRSDDEGELRTTNIALTREAADALCMLLYTNPNTMASMIKRADGSIPKWVVSNV
jgi:hypothetical protein